MCVRVSTVYEYVYLLTLTKTELCVCECWHVQPVAVESRYVCRVHQRSHQSSNLGCSASAPGRHHDDNWKLTDVDDKTTSGSRAMTSSSRQPYSEGETGTGERMMTEEDGEKFAAAADDDADDDDGEVCRPILALFRKNTFQ